jgi:DNA polymerase I
MEISFQLFDVDYIQLENSPVVRLFGKTKDGKTICVFYKGYYPYFYVLPKENSKGELLDFLESSNLVFRTEETEKFLPIGFNEKKAKLIKVFLRDPARVPEIRDELKRKEFVAEIFEADVLFKYRFMADFNLSCMKWYKVNGEGKNTHIVKVNRIIEMNTIEEVEEESNVDFKYLSIDIEISKEGLPDPQKDQVAIISLNFHPGFNGRQSLVLVSKPVKKVNNDVITFKNETEMLTEFVKIIDSYDPDIITGYNINNFDFPFILERLRQCKVSPLIGRCNQKPAISKKLGTRFKNSITGRTIVDVYRIIKEAVEKGQAKIFRLKRYGLGDVAKEILNETKVEVAHSEISKYWNGSEEQFNKLIEYARKDAVLALRLLLERSLLDKFIEISKITGLSLQDTLDGGETTRVENLFLKEFNKKDFVLPLKPDDKEVFRRIDEREAKGLKGALVLDPAVGLHTNVVYLDFKAMYPSIIIAYNICPTTILTEKKNIEKTVTPSGAEFAAKEVREGIIPRIVKHLIEERDRIKAQMKVADKEERKTLDSKQDALKIITNSFYGQTGYLKARLYVLDIANAITSCGRNFIMKTKEIVEEDPSCKVIYGDTDSLIVNPHAEDIEQTFKKGTEIEERVNKALEGKIQMKIESVFRTLLILSKKRYAGLSCKKVNGEWVGEITMKGIETVRRDWCNLVEETLYTVLEIVLKEQDTKKAFNYVKEILEKLDKNQIPIEKLVITKSISKSLKEYKGTQPHIELLKKLKKRSPVTAPGTGDRIDFVIIKGPQLMSDRAEDPEYVKQKGLKIDSKYYIESQVLPPLERVFEAIGIGKSELIGVGKQLLLADAIRNGIKKPEKEQPLQQIDGFICSRCNKTFRRVPLIGKCTDCKGEILFYFGENKSRYFAL